VIGTQPGGVVGLLADLLLSWGPGFLILATAGLFGGSVWIFEAARSRVSLMWDAAPPRLRRSLG
jgi:hypothetical protein